MKMLAARSTQYRGIRMRSRLEAYWAAFFDEHGLRWKYEPDCFASPEGQYLPDFRVDEVYVEIKGVVADCGELQRRMEVIWESEPESLLVLVVGTPKTPTSGRWSRPDFWWESAPRWTLGFRSVNGGRAHWTPECWRPPVDMWEPF